jgi:hypothetical protein
MLPSYPLVDAVTSLGIQFRRDDVGSCQYLQQNDPAVESDKPEEMRDKCSQAFVDRYLPSVVVPSASRIHEIRVRIGAPDPFDGTLCHGEEQRGVLSSKSGPVGADIHSSPAAITVVPWRLILRPLNGSAVS